MNKKLKRKRQGGENFLRHDVCPSCEKHTLVYVSWIEIFANELTDKDDPTIRAAFFHHCFYCGQLCGEFS